MASNHSSLSRIQSMTTFPREKPGTAAPLPALEDEEGGLVKSPQSSATLDNGTLSSLLIFFF